MLDYFNALVCYSRSPGTAYNANPRDVWGKGTCQVVTTDIATGRLITMGWTAPGVGSGVGTNPAFGASSMEAAFGGVAESGFAIDVAVKAFVSKSGDPTRALYCYVAIDAATGTPNIVTPADLSCSVISRLGLSLTYKNSQRDPITGAATDGVRITTLVATGARKPTIAALDPYNMIVCYEKTDTSSVACRHLWVTGYGSSTYNSDHDFNGVADAASPQNVGSVQTLNMGSELVISDGADGAATLPFVSAYITWDVDNESGYFFKSVVCYTKATANRPACNMISATPIRKTWAFNAAVDCVNGYGCPTWPSRKRKLGLGVLSRKTNGTVPSMVEVQPQVNVTQTK
jgi:hypothetical protein